jgi:hypothetical protein
LASLVYAGKWFIYLIVNAFRDAQILPNGKSFSAIPEPEKNNLVLSVVSEPRLQIPVKGPPQSRRFC